MFRMQGSFIVIVIAIHFFFKELFLVIETYEILGIGLFLFFSLCNPVNNNNKKTSGYFKAHAFIFNTFQREYVNCDSPSEQ